MPNKDLSISSKTDIARFLEQSKQLAPRQNSGKTGRLLFCLDATASRQPTWDTACQLQGEMFLAVKTQGNLAIQLCYYRGFNEFRASQWHTSANNLLRTMSSVSCLGGHTQIAKLLKHALKLASSETLHAVIFIGDAVEESPDKLCQLAGKLGIRKIPVFIFQENHDPQAKNIFKQIAHLSGGAYAQFDSHSAAILSNLLNAVAVYATAGHQALIDHAKSNPQATALLSQLKK